MTENDWLIYNGTEGNGINSSEDILPNTIDVIDEIKSADARFVEGQYAGMTLSGEPIDYSFNRYGQLTMEINGWAVKGGVRTGIHRAILNSRRYFTIEQEVSITGNWTIVKGIMFPNGSKQRVGILMHSESIIGIYKSGTDVSRTIEWFEKNIYKTNWKQMRVHRTIDYRPETPSGVYKTQSPEFTKEDELEEIRAFITSMKERRLSGEEIEILRDIESEIGRLI